MSIDQHSEPNRMKKPAILRLKIYTPAADFAESKRFYSALGFELTEGWGDTVDCRLGAAEFRLQNYFVKEWAENFMMQFAVDDIPGWYDHAKEVIVSGNFKNARISEPETVGDAHLFHVWDPSGVLLIFIQ